MGGAHLEGVEIPTPVFCREETRFKKGAETLGGSWFPTNRGER